MALQYHSLRVGVNFGPKQRDGQTATDENRSWQSLSLNGDGVLSVGLTYVKHPGQEQSHDLQTGLLLLTTARMVPARARAILEASLKPQGEHSMTVEQLISDAATLPPCDRLRIVQALWDSLPEDAFPAPRPEIKAEFDRRMAEYRENPGSAMTIDELRDRLEADRAK